jgi:hypothetical protein
MSACIIKNSISYDFLRRIFGPKRDAVTGGWRIKMDLLEIGLSVVDWIGLARDKYRWRALVNLVMNLRVP